MSTQNVPGTGTGKYKDSTDLFLWKCRVWEGREVIVLQRLKIFSTCKLVEAQRWKQYLQGKDGLEKESRESQCELTTER